jgi:hypothetical protein
MLRSCVLPTLAALLAAAPSSAAAVPAPLDAPTLSAHIDTHLAARQTRDAVQLAPLAEDAEFIRRLFLDLVGRIPTVAELKDFLDDSRSDKRARWIDELLDGPDHADLAARHFANHWRHVLLARTTGNNSLYAPQLESWLQRQFQANTSYDRLVRELLTSSEAVAFYRAQENKPEELAGSTARLFLGVKVECAQCHDDRTGGPWKRTQFWELAAFFSRLPAPNRQGNTLRLGFAPDNPIGPARIRIPDTSTWVDGRFLDGSQPPAKPERRPEEVLADWLTRADNPWFARAAVNRLWHYCFGTGLIDPVDGLGHDAQPSHPELLDELTQQFIAHRFDLKYMLRALMGSQAYQRTSRLTHASQKEPRQFARAAVRGQSAEQIYQSFLTATGFRPTSAPSTGRMALYGPTTPAGHFLAKFYNPHEQPTEMQMSIQQALYLMNDPLIDDATSLKQSGVLAAVVKAGPSRSTAQRIEDLFLAVLARSPRPEESERLVKYVEEGSPGEERTAALRDVFWALLNSTEFILNH